jgi:hypothetical protein
MPANGGAGQAKELALKQVTFEMKIHFPRGAMTVSVPVPDREMRVADLLPLLHGVQDAVTLGIVKDVESRGQRISCKAGCGVCCRQPVPIAESEAVRLAELVAGMPGERRERIRARFAEARREKPMPRFSAPEMMRNLIAQLSPDTEGPDFHL